jgi:chromosome segregation and condensation protein ScpB
MGDRTFRLQVTSKFHQYFQLEDLPQPFTSLKESLAASEAMEESEPEVPELF